MEGRSSRYQITIYVYGEPLPEGVTYKSRSEIQEVTSRESETIYTEDASIQPGIKKRRSCSEEGMLQKHIWIKYVNGELEDSKLLYTDKYKGNPAEISIGTGPALQEGEAVPEGARASGHAAYPCGFKGIRACKKEVADAKSGRHLQKMAPALRFFYLQAF